MSPTARLQISEAMRRMEGKRIKVRLSEVRRKCSTPQKRYYWGVIIPAIQRMFTEAGDILDAEEVHMYLKEHVGKLVRFVKDPTGARLKIVRSITDTETPEFSQYLECIWAWAAQMGCQISSPNEVYILA